MTIIGLTRHAFRHQSLYKYKFEIVIVWTLNVVGMVCVWNLNLYESPVGLQYIIDLIDTHSKLKRAYTYSDTIKHLAVYARFVNKQPERCVA